MRYYGHRGYHTPRYLIQGVDTTGEQRSVGCQFDDIALLLAKHFKSGGFWRVKYRVR